MFMLCSGVTGQLPDRSAVDQLLGRFSKPLQKDTLSDFLSEHFPQSALLRTAKLPNSEILPLLNDARLLKTTDFVLPNRAALAEALALQPGPPPEVRMQIRLVADFWRLTCCVCFLVRQSVVREYRLSRRKA
jgi:hypothetical protein